MTHLHASKSPAASLPLEFGRRVWFRKHCPSVIFQDILCLGEEQIKAGRRLRRRWPSETVDTIATGVNPIGETVIQRPSQRRNLATIGSSWMLAMVAWQWIAVPC